MCQAVLMRLLVNGSSNADHLIGAKLATMAPSVSGGETPPPKVTFLSGTPKSQKKFQDDKKYEFSAPQYYDFNGPSPGGAGGQSESSWFDKLHSLTTPKEDSTKRKSVTPSSGKPSLGVPPTVTQDRQRHFDDAVPGTSLKVFEKGNNSSITKREKVLAKDQQQEATLVKSPTLITTLKRSPRNLFEASSSSPSENKKEVCYDEIFQMVKKKTGKSEKLTFDSFESKLGKTRTLDKAKLNRLKIAAPLLTSRSTKPLTVPIEFQFSERNKHQRRVSFDLSASHERSKIEEQRFPKEMKIPITNNTKFKVIHQKPFTTVPPQSPRLFTIKSREEKTISGLPPLPLQQVHHDPKILKTKKSKITIPTSVNLATAARAKSAPTTKNVVGDNIQSTSPFRATPIPIEILHHPVGVPVKKEHSLTVPITPNISKPRKRVVGTTSSKEEPIPPPPPTTFFKARSVPHKKPFAPVIQHQSMKVPSVHLPGDLITEQKRQKFQAALKREREAAEAARRFQALPMPHYNNTQDNNAGVPPPKTRPLTRPEPFHLMSDIRSHHYQTELEKKLREEEICLVKKREFQPRPVPHVAPFMPKKSTKPLTQIESVHLHSSDRAEKRREFDEKLHQKELEMAERERQQQELRKQREEAEISELRKQLVPKAKPIVHYPPVKVQPSNRPLTVPHSPPLYTFLRSRKRHENE